MAIKNWTVTAESTKSAAAREQYLNNKNHKNHKNTERIFNVFGGVDTTANIIRNAEKRRLETSLKGKGGRPPTEAMEFVLTLPKGIRPSQEQWRAMGKSVVTDVAKRIGIAPNEFNGIVRGVTHQQKQEGKGSGDHMHLMIGKFTNSGKYLPELQKKSVLHTIKMSFNAAVYETMGIDHSTYQAQKTYDGVAKKRVPQWVANAAKSRDELLVAKNELDNREVDLDVKDFDLALREEELRSQTAYAENLTKLTYHLKKLDEALLENDQRQVKRQVNRANKSIFELAIETQNEAFKMTPELEAATDRVNTNIGRLNDVGGTEVKKINRPKPSF